MTRLSSWDGNEILWHKIRPQTEFLKSQQIEEGTAHVYGFGPVARVCVCTKRTTREAAGGQRVAFVACIEQCPCLSALGKTPGVACNQSTGVGVGEYFHLSLLSWA